MSVYNYQEIDQKISILNAGILGAARRMPVFAGVMAGVSVCSVGAGAPIYSVGAVAAPGRDILSAVEKAAGEIKQYVAEIWNDTEKREQMLEKMQDELSENIQSLRKKREELEGYQARMKNVTEKERDLAKSLASLIDDIHKKEAELREVYDVYRSANNKGWKIMFYPELAYKALKYTAENRDGILRRELERYRQGYDSLFSEKHGYLRQEDEFARKIKDSMESIAKAETALVMQKMELGNLKRLIVKGSNAYIYYSMLLQKMQTAGSILAVEKEFCVNMENMAVREEELEGLLALWKKNESDSETVYRILKEMFQTPRTGCVGKEIGDEFDDSSYVRGYFEKIKGIHIQSGYIIDGIQALYERSLRDQFHGGMGGGEHIIEFEPEDELKGIEGHYNVPFMIPSGDAIGELYIITKKERRYGPYGDSMHRGIGFKLEIPDDARFMGFFGRSSGEKFITQLGLLYEQKEQEMN